LRREALDDEREVRARARGHGGAIGDDRDVEPFRQTVEQAGRKRPGAGVESPLSQEGDHVYRRPEPLQLDLQSQ